MRKALPIWAMPKGSFSRDDRWTLAKFVKIPWAVSGRRYAVEALSTMAPMRVSKSRLKSRTAVSAPPSIVTSVTGDGTSGYSSGVASTRRRSTTGASRPFSPSDLRSRLAFFAATSAGSAASPASPAMTDT